MNEDQVYVTIKFVTGDTCVGALMENNPLSVVIANPITITTGLDQQDGEMVERLVMNKFCYLTDDQFFTFSKKDIIFCASLKESLIGPYKKLCMAMAGSKVEEESDKHLDINEIPYIYPGSSTLN